MEGEVETADTREALSALEDDLDGRWDKILDKWQVLLETYPDPGQVLDDNGEEIQDEQQVQEVRGLYSAREQYMEGAEVAQNRLEAAIRSKLTQINLAARGGREDADQMRARAEDLSSNVMYETALSHWMVAKGRIYPKIDKLRIALELAEVSPDLAKAKKFERWAEDIDRLRVQMDSLTSDMIKLVPEEAEAAKTRQIAENTKIEDAHGRDVIRVQDYMSNCLEKRDELEDARSESARGTTPDPDSRSDLAGGGSRGIGGLSLEKLKCQAFSGKMQDYPTWKDDWNELIHMRMDSRTEMVKLRENVPIDAKMELTNLKTLDEAWSYLDKEYGNKRKMTSRRVKDLHEFRYTAQAKSDSAKTRELHRIWRQVYTDLEKVGAQENLDNDTVVQGFVSKFPLELRKEWVRFEEKAENDNEKLSSIVNKFLTSARDEVQKLEIYDDGSSSISPVKTTAAGVCALCGKNHPTKDCWQLKKRSNVATGVQKDGGGSGAGASTCPICSVPHRRKDAKGRYWILGRSVRNESGGN